jgi:hypothetical protein
MKMDIPAYALDDRELWTVKLVKDALVDAYRMLQHSGGRVGPRGAKAYWPAYALDLADFNEQSIAGTLKQQRPKPSYSTRMNPTRMEMVLCGWKDDHGVQHPAWLVGIPDADLREKLEAWVFAELRGTATTDLCIYRGWALATFKRHRDKAAGLVAQTLNLHEQNVW